MGYASFYWVQWQCKAFQSGSWCSYMGWVWQGLQTQRYENVPSQLGHLVKYAVELPHFWGNSTVEPVRERSGEPLEVRWDTQIGASLPLSWGVSKYIKWWKSNAFHASYDQYQIPTHPAQHPHCGQIRCLEA